MKVLIDNVITIIDPTEEINKWVSKNLTFNNPEYQKKKGMGFSVWNTPRHFRMFECQEGNKLIVPYGVLRSLLPMIDGQTELLVKENPRVHYNANIELYDYQKRAVDFMISEYYGILQAPPGSGKTQMGLAIICRLGRRALWITHTKDLLEQSYARAKQYMDESLLGKITEGKINTGKGITFATVQTLSNIDLNRYRDYWDVIIVDECHRVGAKASSVTMFEKVLNNLSAIFKYGLSATVHRSDGLVECTKALLGDVIWIVQQVEVADKTMKIGIAPVFTGTRYGIECTYADGKLSYTALVHFLAKEEDRNMMIADKIVKHKGKSQLILSSSLEHLTNIMSYLPDDIRELSVFVSGQSTAKTRKEAMEDMRSGKKKYLFATFNLAKEGLDIPRLEYLHLTTPQKDYAVISQAIGRVARICEGKDNPIVYDYIDDDPYAAKTYKKRYSTYKKNDCYLVEDGEE